MGPTPQNEPSSNPKQTDWTDAIEASAKQPTRETVEDVIEVKLTDSDLADIARENAADDHEKSLIKAEVDALKEELKDKKVAIEAIEQRIKDRNNSVRKGSVARKGEWIVLSLFEQNTVQYLDPKSERVVFERPMDSAERQVELALDAAIASVRKPDADEGAAAESGADVTDPDALLRAASAMDSEDDEVDLTDEDDDADGDE